MPYLEIDGMEGFVKELVALIRKDVAATTRPLLEEIAELKFKVAALKAKEYAASDAGSSQWRGPGKDKPRLLSIKGAA